MIGDYVVSLTTYVLAFNVQDNISSSTLASKRGSSDRKLSLLIPGSPCTVDKPQQFLNFEADSVIDIGTFPSTNVPENQREGTNSRLK